MTPGRIVLWITCVLALAIPGAAAAQTTADVSPTTLDFGSVAAGSVAVQPLAITNRASTARAFDITVSGDVAGWMSMHRDDLAALDDTGDVVTVTIDPGQSLSLSARVEVPSSAPPGSPVGMIQVIERVDGDGNGVTLEVPVNIVVADERVVAGEVVSFEAPDVSVGFRIEVQAVLRNTGNVVFNPDAQIVIFNGDQQVAATAVRGGQVSPGREQLVFFAMDSVLPQGTYRVEAAFRVDDVELGAANADVSVLSVEEAADTAPPAATGGAGSNNRRNLALAVAAAAVVAVLLGAAWSRRSGPTALHAETDKARPGRAARGRHHAESGESAWQPTTEEPPTSRPKRARS